MAGKKVEYEIAVDSSKGVSGIKSFTSTVKKELKSIEGDFDDTATAGEKVATVLSKMAGQLDTELDRAAQAAEALSRALGPELAAGADVGAIVGDLQKMGLSFEDIVADADKLAAALKELDQVQMKGLDSGLGGVSTKIGGVNQKLGGMSRSAGGANSALANMIGNTTQDLGALTGLAGSAGVAIGQMGEYAADAALDGEKLGASLASMAAVAGPIAAMAVVMAGIGAVMKDMSDFDTFNAEQIDAWSSALKEGGDVAAAWANHIREIGELELHVPLKTLGDDTHDVLPLISSLGIGIDKFTNIALQGNEAIFAWGEAMKAAGVPVDDVNAIILAATSQHVAHNNALKAEAATADALAISQRSVNQTYEEWLDLQDPVARFPERFDRIADALARGVAPAAKDVEFLMKKLGITTDEVLTIGQQRALELAAAADAASAAVARAADATKDHQLKIDQAIKDAHAAAIAAQQAHADAMEKQFIALAETEVKLEDIAGVFEQIGARGDALRSIFDLQNKPLDVEGQVRDIELAIDDLSETAKDVDLSEGLDPSNVNADALLDAIDSLRPEIQQRVVEAFSAGGPEAAIALAQDYIRKVAEELNISEMDAAKLLGMEDITAFVKVALDQTSLANAQAQLDILTGLGGETPLTASIALGLQAGTLTADQAQLLVQDALRGEGVEIPGELAIKPKPGEMRKAREALQTEADDNPTQQPVEPKGLEKAAAIITAGPAGGWPAIEVPVVPVLPSGYSPSQRPVGGPLMAGPTATGLATTGPTATTSSAVPMTLALPMSAPAAARAYTVNVVLNAAVMGAPLDIMRAVDDAMRRGARLLPAGP